MRCASVSIGIVEYAHRFYSSSDMRLRYAVGDAKAFHRYASLGWPAREAPQHRLLCDREATFERLREAVTTITDGGQLDLFFLYLSGHGEITNDGAGWFCLADAEPGVPSFDGAAIDSCLNGVDADHILVFIDCCYAEAVVAGSQSFAIGKGRRARLVAASCRADQRAWEDDGLKRSIFSDVLLRALSTDSTIADARGQVDVQARLLPYLRDQVPTAASAMKRGYDQDPITGGFLSGPLMMPVVSTTSLGRPLTISQAIRAGVRRFLVAGLVAIFVALSIADALIFHLAVDGTGELIVRPGFSATYAALPFHTISNVDTGLSIRDIDTDKDSPATDKLLAALAAGSLWGFATHRDIHHVRTWLAPLESHLRPAVRNLLRAVVFGEWTTPNVDHDPPPLAETFFIAALQGKRPSEIGKGVYPIDLSLRWECTDRVSNQLDFTRLQEDPEVFRRDMRWVVATAPSEPAARARIFADLVKMTAYRGLQETGCEERLANLELSGCLRSGNVDEKLLIEFDGFATSLERVAGDSPTDAFRAAVAPFLESTKGTWCSLPGTFATAVAGTTQTSLGAEGRLRSILESYDRSKQGDTGGNPQQQMAEHGLDRLAHRRRLDPITLQRLYQIIARDTPDLTAPVPAMALLKEVAVSQELTPDLRNLLFRNLRHETGAGDFSALTACNLLARNFAFLNSDERTNVRRWLADAASANVFVSEFHEALGFVSLTEPLPANQLGLLGARLSSMSRFPPQATSYRGEMVITSTGDSAAVALGRVAQAGSLPRDILERLANIAAARTEIEEREEIVRGLARQWYRRATDLADRIRDRLPTGRGDATRRALEVDVAVSALADIPASERKRLLNRLIAMWSHEPDPSQRVALATIIGSLGLILK